MIIQYTQEEFDNAKDCDKLPLVCQKCGTTFFIRKKKIKRTIKDIEKTNNTNLLGFCSVECFMSIRFPLVESNCYTCGKTFKHKKKQPHDCQKPFCSQLCANRYSSNINKAKKTIGLKVWLTSEEGKRKTKENALKRSEKAIVFKKTCPVCEKEFKVWNYNKKRIYCSKQCYLSDKDYQFRKKPICGGYRKGSGYGKSGWYHGIHCDSTWELAWVIFNEEHHVKFERITEPFVYSFDGVQHKYFPDFKLEDGTIIEIKGRKSREECSSQTKAKIDSVPNLKVLYKKDMEPILKYVTLKYGWEFIKLYEGNPHNKRLNKCEICGNPAFKRFCSRSCSGKKLVILKSKPS